MNNTIIAVLNVDAVFESHKGIFEIRKNISLLDFEVEMFMSTTRAEYERLYNSIQTSAIEEIKQMNATKIQKLKDEMQQFVEKKKAEKHNMQVQFDELAEQELDRITGEAIQNTNVNLVLPLGVAVFVGPDCRDITDLAVDILKKEGVFISEDEKMSTMHEQMLKLTEKNKAVVTDGTE